MAPINANYSDLTAPLNSLRVHNPSNRLDTAETFDLQRPKWQADAACLGYISQGKDWWFPTQGEHGNAHINAKQVCNTCPVKAECLADAMTQGPYCVGIWGGTTQNDRKELRVRGTRPGPVRKERHGTQYAYDKRKCRCQECCDAHSKAMARYRARRQVA